MPVKQVQRTSLVDTVVGELRAEISSGAWPVGSRIPTEAELIGRLAVSRPSLREAVRSLVQIGLLETRQGDGTYVVADDPTDVALRRKLDESDRRDVIAVRRALDVLAATEAATRRSEEDLGLLRRHLLQRADAVARHDAEAFADHDVAFHIGIARASQNALLLALYRSFEASLRRAVLHRSCFGQEVNGQFDDLHEALFCAIERGDPQAASSAALGMLAQQAADS